MSLIRSVIGVECDTHACEAYHFFIDFNNQATEIKELGWSWEILPALLESYYYCPKCTREPGDGGRKTMDNDCPVCQGRKTILTRDYQDCEREEPCPHCSEHEHCASCIALRAENARLREAVEMRAAVEKATARLVCAYMMDEAELRESVAEEYDTLETAIKEPGV